MSPLAISLMALFCIFSGTLLGMVLQIVLPEDHLKKESTDAIKLGIGIIATLTALVLGLLTASAKGTFDTVNNGLKQGVSRIMHLDRLLANYGPETMEARLLLRRSVVSAIERLWPEDEIEPSAPKNATGTFDIEAIPSRLSQLTPRTEAQRWLQSRALHLSDDIIEGRWNLIEQRGQGTLPMPFLVVLVFWLTFIFIVYGLFSPRNTTVVVVFLICALSVAGSLFLILELDTPYEGLIKVSSRPFQSVLGKLGK